ncbi:MAG: hypothetical protein PHX10_10450 [Gallionellaceae bacterium]|nr:hypothetical protein [Gallionellaceae bacterium]
MFQLRHDFVAQPVAGQRQVGIALVVDVFDRLGAGMRVQGGTTDRKQRAQDRPAFVVALTGHGGQAVHPGAAQQAEQQGFGLVVEMVGQDDVIHRLVGIGPVAGGAGRRLQAGGLGHDLDPADGQGNAEPAAGAAAVLGPGVGVDRETVMDVYGGQAVAEVLAQARQQVQQDGGVQSAGIAQSEAGAGGKARAQEITDLAGQINDHGSATRVPLAGKTALGVAARRQAQRALVSLNLP